MTGFLVAEAVRRSFDGVEALRGVSLSVRRGERLAVVGPNGSGKTTLLRLLAGALAPSAGCVRLEGRDLRRIPRREAAKSIAYLPAETATPFAFTAAQLVAIGRTPYLGWFGREGERDRRAVERSLRATGTQGLADRPVPTLSSGERQRVFLAQALAQEPAILLLDEPTAHLDLSHEVALFDRLAEEARAGLGWIAVLHDLDLASEYAERILLLNAGSVVACGSPAEVVREEVLRPVFGRSIRVDVNPATGAPNVRIVPGVPAVARPRSED